MGRERGHLSEEDTSEIVPRLAVVLCRQLTEALKDV